MKSIIFAVITLTFATVESIGQAQASPTKTTAKTTIKTKNYSEDHQAILAVVEQFEQAIINKDKASFMPLFVDKNVSWIGVFDDATVEYRKRLIASLPKDKQVPLTRMFHSTPAQFIDNIVAAKPGSIETIENVQVSTDGMIASVNFDYEYLREGVKHNWGKEYWHIVKTMQGWRISSVVYSLSFDRKETEN